MGQRISQPERRTEDDGRPTRSTSVLRRGFRRTSNEVGQQDSLLNGQQSEEGRPQRMRTRPVSLNRLSQLFHSDSDVDMLPNGERGEGSRTSQVLQRTRSTIRDMLSRGDAARARRQHTYHSPYSGILQHRASYIRSGSSRRDAEFAAPRLPSIDLSSSFDREPFNSPDPEPQLNPSGSHPRSTSRLNSFRPDRSFRRFASLRRRRSPPPSIRRIGGTDDQAVMLSRLLSVAAAATAATLMGDDHNALNDARSLTGGTGIGDIGGHGEDGSFDGFLRSLQSGRIASALRGGTEIEDGSPDTTPSQSLNFFRMFRFGSSAAGNAPTSPEAPASEDAANNPDGRMVPIIIVGIRSISPNSGSAYSAENDLPPFIDALGNFPSPLPTHAFGAHGHDSIDSILQPPQNHTSFRHRRRASMGAFGMSRNRLSDRMDDQRDHRSPDRRRERPRSIASSSSTFEPRPPPATPASPSPELSRISSRHTTPNTSRPASLIASSLRDLGSDSRRNSTLHRSSAASPLSSHTEETTSLHSTHSSTNLLAAEDADEHASSAHRRSETAPNIHYPRFASGHPRRNGVVEPDNLPPLSRTSTSNGTVSSNNERRNSSTESRSWIIYVLGGSYPENHPILTTPSLFTENPTYEDMMLLSALLGPAKAPVATEEEVQSAGGLYSISLSDSAANGTQLVAIATEDGEDRVLLDIGQRCLVCLCDFDVDESARKLIKCNHLFHQECIDQWLTQGRNSCPLCRGQGVDEKERPSNRVYDELDVNGDPILADSADDPEVRQVIV